MAEFYLELQTSGRPVTLWIASWTAEMQFHWPQEGWAPPGQALTFADVVEGPGIINVSWREDGKQRDLPGIQMTVQDGATYVATLPVAEKTKRFPAWAGAAAVGVMAVLAIVILKGLPKGGRR